MLFVLEPNFNKLDHSSEILSGAKNKNATHFDSADRLKELFTTSNDYVLYWEALILRYVLCSNANFKEHGIDEPKKNCGCEIRK